MLSESAYVAPSATLCGAVTLGERARVLHGAVLTAEDGEIWVGNDVVIMGTHWYAGARGIRCPLAMLCSSGRTLT